MAEIEQAKVARMTKAVEVLGRDLAASGREHGGRVIKVPQSNEETASLS